MAERLKETEMVPPEIDPEEMKKVDEAMQQLLKEEARRGFSGTFGGFDKPFESPTKSIGAIKTQVLTAFIPGAEKRAVEKGDAVVLALLDVAKRLGEKANELPGNDPDPLLGLVTLLAILRLDSPPMGEVVAYAALQKVLELAKVLGINTNR